MAFAHIYDSITRASGGSVTYPLRGRLGPRIQPHIQLVMVHSGHAQIYIDDQEFLVPAGHVALLCPGHEEYYRFSDHTETRHSWVHIEVGAIEEELIRELEALPKCIALSTHMNYLTEVVCELTKQSSYRSTDELKRTIAMSMLLLYESECTHNQQHLQKHHAVLKAIEEIQHNYSQPIDLKKLAKEATVSPEHLIRLFAEHEGTTPMKYLWKVRVERVVELLLHSGLSLKEIAEKTGFQNTHHLSRMVTFKTGLTPSEIRKRNVQSVTRSSV